MMDLDDSLSLTLSELEQGWYNFLTNRSSLALVKMFCSVGIPKITGTSELFDAYPAIVASYNVIIHSEQQTEQKSQTEAEEEETLPPLLFSQFERFLFLIKKYFLLCKVRWGRWLYFLADMAEKLFRFLEITN